MEADATIGHFNIIKSLDKVHMKRGALIGSMNWISANLTGFNPKTVDLSVRERIPCLLLGKFASVSSRHYLDCSDSITIDDFTDLAGIRSVLLSHHMNVKLGTQMCQPIVIGKNCFIGTNCVILGGAGLPDYSILAAGAVLVEYPEESFVLYAGTPAVRKKVYDRTIGWFNRSPSEILLSRKRWSANPWGQASGKTDPLGGSGRFIDARRNEIDEER
mgnify:CR=1 FL=1